MQQVKKKQEMDRSYALKGPQQHHLNSHEVDGEGKKKGEGGVNQTPPSGELPDNEQYAHS